MYLIEGLLLGFGSILLIGPVVFLLLDASMNNSKAGIAVALGIIVGDIIYVAACFKSIEYIIGNENFNYGTTILGFLILFTMGISYFFKKHKNIKDSKNTKSLKAYFVEGFSVNFFNPFVLSVWLTVVNYAKTSHQTVSISYLIAVLLGIFLIDIFKVFLAKKLFKLINSKQIEIFYKISAVIMIIFSLRILYSLF